MSNNIIDSAQIVKNIEDMRCYGAYSLDDEIRNASTSGGIFSCLAQAVLLQNGYVCGAAYNAKNEVEHIIISNINDLELLRRSKYVQSRIGNCYIDIKRILDNGDLLLFSGAPCQVSGLNLFLGKNYENLLTVDFICCGMPSPKAFRKYIDYLADKYKSAVESVWFKNKTNGWHNLGTKVEFENGSTYFRQGNRDYFMSDYIFDSLTVRESCTVCQFKHIPHDSDITMGDFWGIEDIHSEFDDDKGISAVIINSKKGRDAFEAIRDGIFCFETNINDIAKKNFTLYQSIPYNYKQKSFFEELEIKRFDKVSRKYGSYRGIRKTIIDMKHYMRIIIRRLI
ncbi:MAG: Coenzyme F420 hydrogenase/dehydrogenase, beta subunit C-terminal domain [Lachnospiraceae bacterium]|nr:Coenzyme F420 hydrogenase/dehydrogenase, beta subunit C-terminal domain [Lachnospiraceae bacterium]